MGPVTSIVTGLSERLGDLRARVLQALQMLAMALRSDPRDPVQAIGADGCDGLDRLGPPDRPVAGSRAGGVDRDNLDRLTADLHSTNIATLAMAMGVRAALEKARAGGGVAQLLVYESAGSGSQGRAAISVGDITTADNVATLAPGVSNAPVNMADGISTAAALRDEAQRLAPGDATAVVAWYGYDIPLSAIRGVPVGPLATVDNAAAALNDENARAGGALLAGDIARFHQLAPATARFVAIGFSMGATTVSAAAARGAAIDDLVMLGSPGASSDVRTAHDYPRLPAKHAYALSYDQDPITLGSHRPAGRAGGQRRPATDRVKSVRARSGVAGLRRPGHRHRVERPRSRRCSLSFGPFPDLLGSAIAERGGRPRRSPSGAELLLGSLAVGDRLGHRRPLRRRADQAGSLTGDRRRRPRRGDAGWSRAAPA